MRDLSEVQGPFDFIILGSVGPVFESYTVAMESLKGLLRDDGAILLDDGYVDDGRKHPVTLERKELFAQIERAGMRIEREYTGDEICIEDEFEGQLQRIRSRCGELSERFPEKEPLFRRYVQEQESEYGALADEVRCSTMVIRKAG